MSRLPIRLRLTLAFALAMAIVLTAVGALLYTRVGDALDEQLDENLELRAEALAELVREGAVQPGSIDLSRDDESVAEVLDPDAVPQGAAISAAEARRATEGAFVLSRGLPSPLEREPARYLVSPVRSDGQPLVLVVGVSLEDREETLDKLLAQLLIVAPLALIVSTLAAYWLAGAALRPVEAMRRRAGAIGSDGSGHRLPLPEARDEIRRLGETLNDMLARLEGGLARERRFVADASHELRTPLALLRTELELALRLPRTPEELEAALASAADEVDRLMQLAEDLLVLARVDEGGLPLRREQLQAADLLETVARRFSPRAAEAGRSLEVRAGEEVVLIGDRLRLEQALGNLVDNALRHGAGTVYVEAARQDGTAELCVSDEGAGFPPEFLDHAFDRFARADEARGGGSTGLGLSIVAAIARAHGGSAEAANRNGTGALVRLRLPAE